MSMRRTKIVCTIGPASESPFEVEEIARAGMNVARLNFAHGSDQEHINRIHRIRDAEDKLDHPIAILQDIPGAKARTGPLEQKRVTLEEGQTFKLTTFPVIGNEYEVSIDMPNLPRDVHPGDIILVDDGVIRLEVIDNTEMTISCKVIRGGQLGAEKGINIPGVPLNAPPMTQQDINHILLGIEHGVDYIAVSFVRSAADILAVTEFLRQEKADILVIAKIENHQALNNIDEIIAVSDGIMIARGDLGVEVPIEKVPIIQKQLIKKCNHAGKPVIVATQMLESMEDSPYPTRAEVTDVANAIIDGADAVMLAGETAIGTYPEPATRMMARIATETESIIPYETALRERGTDLEPHADDAISYAACHTAHQLDAKAIIALTTSGSTARRVSKYRPRVPILAITPSDNIRRRLALTWGIRPYKAAEALTIEELFCQANQVSQRVGTAQPGDLVIITAGLPIGVPGSTNLLKVENVR
ncbi:MAG: pyruvate kinase [Chloroflexota bacterium]|nr:pyruvate kinase [Chloroflexota bacterium]